VVPGISSRASSRDRGWPPRAASPDAAWLLLWLVGLAGLVVFARWRAAPWYLAWLCFALLYSARLHRDRAASWPLAAMVVLTFGAIGTDAATGAGPAGELADVPLMAAMFWVMLWHADRRLAADTERARSGGPGSSDNSSSDNSARQLATQSRFLQDVSHQFRTPITIALGHAELLASSLADGQQQRDIHVVVGELNRLARLSERLLLIAASENSDFLRPGPVSLPDLAIEALRRWRPAAPRSWQLGQLDHVVVSADAERLGLAVDSLLENAVQHTGPDELIRLSVVCGEHTQFARMIIEDAGAGIPQDALARIFDRFSTGGSPGGRQGTGLGLALVCAVMRGHGGEVLVQSTPRQGSRFELLLPVQAADGQDRQGTPRTALTAGSPGGTG
jgi:two-component system OmpR family sensor kinase